jgi:hypothetical protein
MREGGGWAIALTELLGVLGEGHGGAVVVGVHDPRLRVLGPERPQLPLEHRVVVLREVVVRPEASGGVVVAAVAARVQGQVRRRAAHGQVPRHHQVRGAGLDQPLQSRSRASNVNGQAGQREIPELFSARARERCSKQMERIGSVVTSVASVTAAATVGT